MDILTKNLLRKILDDYKIEIPLKKEEKEEVVVTKNSLRKRIQECKETLKYLEEEYEMYDPLYTYEECEEVFGAYTDECRHCKRNIDYNDNQRGMISESISLVENEIKLIQELLRKNITSFRLKKNKKYKIYEHWDESLIEYECNLNEKDIKILHNLLNKYFARKDIKLVKKGGKFFFLSEEEGPWPNPILLYLFKVDEG